MKVLDDLNSVFKKTDCAVCAIAIDGMNLARVTPDQKERCFELMAALVMTMAGRYELSPTVVMAEINGQVKIIRDGELHLGRVGPKRGEEDETA